MKKLKQSPSLKASLSKNTLNQRSSDTLDQDSSGTTDWVKPHHFTESDKRRLMSVFLQSEDILFFTYSLLYPAAAIKMQTQPPVQVPAMMVNPSLGSSAGPYSGSPLHSIKNSMKQSQFSTLQN